MFRLSYPDEAVSNQFQIKLADDEYPLLAPVEEVLLPPPMVLSDARSLLTQDMSDWDQQPGPANQVELRPSEILPGTRVGSTIYHDGHGFYYHCNKTKNKRRLLKCINRTRSKCHAWATMGVDEHSPIVLTRNSPYHNHAPDFQKMNQVRLRERLKERSREEMSVPVSEIFSEEARRDPEAAVSISRSSITKAMKRQKRKTDPLKL